MVVLTNAFKFEIGETVQFKNAPYHTFLIIEQHIQICIGGQQIKYTVRPYNKERFGGIGEKYMLFNEMELEKEKEDDTVKVDPKETNRAD